MTASDLNGDVITFSAFSTSLLTNATFSPAGAFAFTPDSTQIGTFQVTFTATDNGTPPLSASETITITGIDVPNFIRGTAHFEKKVVDLSGLTNRINLTPIRSADVEIFRDADGTVVASGNTDSSGSFSILVPETEAVSPLRVRIIARQVDSILNVRVVDGLNEFVTPHVITGALYAVTSGVFTGPQSALQITATADDATGRKAGAFNIFDAFIRATDFIKAVAPDTVFPPLVFRFKIGVNDGVFFSRNDVQLVGSTADFIAIGDQPGLDTNDFDDSVILHETGHYLHKNFSKSSSPGGTHRGEDRLDSRLAYSEGWANFFGQAVIGTPLSINSKTPFSSTFSLETFNPETMATTYESQRASSHVLWDLFDSGLLSTDGDTLSIGFDSIWNNGFVPLRSPTVHFVYLHSFLDQLKSVGVITAFDINSNFCGIGRPDICDPPRNDWFSTSIPAPFPQFVIGPNEIVICGVSKVCAVDDSDQTTLARASAFFRIDLPSAGILTISLTVSAIDDLDLIISEDDQGRKIKSSRRVGKGLNESITAFFQAGTYMIQVNGFSTVVFAPYTLTTTFVP